MAVNRHDRLLFSDPQTGLPCQVAPDEAGVLWGYVGVGSRHPLYGCPVDRCPLECRSDPDAPCEHTPRAVLTGPYELRFGGWLDGRPFEAAYWFGFPVVEDATAEGVRAWLAQLATQLASLDDAASRLEIELNLDL